MNDLIELVDILDSLVFEDEYVPDIMNEYDALELIESALYLMEDYMNENPTAISEPDFEHEMLEDVKELFYIQFENEILEKDWFEDDINDLLEKAFEIFITTFYPERSISNNPILNINVIENLELEMDKNAKKQHILDKIEHIRMKPQPNQRTEEWYKFRHELITASNAYKAFESQSTVNQLIYEKCQPLKCHANDSVVATSTDGNIKSISIPSMVNINTPFHWGQKYEPVSVMIYEYLYNTKVADFGCIKHDNYYFLGASPDGINIDAGSDRFGRMLEIKNIVNREINGIPKKEYWIQMQLQMEVCDLDECDFLETKFIEYDCANTFFKDLENNTLSNSATTTETETETKSLHKSGVIIYFHNVSEGKPYYVYKPFDITTKDEILEWEENKIELYQSSEHNMTYIKSIYWKLEKLSCVLVLRNKIWFNNNIQTLQNVWNIIEKERITGYEHRAPNKRVRKESFDNPLSENESNGCLIKINF